MAVLIFVLRLISSVPNPAIAALLLLLVILITATAVPVRTAVVVSVLATASFNFFLLPPFHTFTITDPQNWVALFVFLAVAIVASQLSAVARARAVEAVARRDELARLFDLSRDVLVMPDSREALPSLARSVVRRFDLEFVALALPAGDDWTVTYAGAGTAELDKAQLSTAFQAAHSALEFDAGERTYAGHAWTDVEDRATRLVPLRLGTKPIGLLAAAGRPIEPGTLDALAGVVAIAIERAKLLEERKEAELTRRSEELKTALLASLGHDLRTPLTAIVVAASNIKSPALSDDDRADQSDLILGEAERLTRLFQNILDMARIDAGAIETEARWTHPSEIVAAARELTRHALERHHVTIDTEADVPLRLDPRLTALAVAHLLENAAKYTPPGSRIEVRGGATDRGLEIRVRDHGPGIAPADLPRLFERFYRGAPTKARASGTGMGLWIARGLL
jgi:two-component system sensor histidine kinase KdpD